MQVTDDGRCLVNKKELAPILGVSERTLTEWQDQGMPIEVVGGRGFENTYDTVKVIEWRIQRTVAGAARETGREKLERLQAEKLEIEIGRQTGEVVLASEIESRWTDAVVGARGEMLNLAHRLKDKVDAAYRVNSDPALFETEILGALAKLAGRAEEFAGADEDLEDDADPLREDAE